MSVSFRSPSKLRRTSARLSDVAKVFNDYKSFSTNGFQATNLGLAIERDEVPNLAEAVANPAAQAEVLHESENEGEQLPKRKRKNKKQRGTVEDANIPAPNDLEALAVIAGNTAMELNSMIEEITSYADEPQGQPKKKARSKKAKKRKSSATLTHTPETGVAPTPVPKKLKFKHVPKGVEGNRMHREALEQLQSESTDERENKRVRKNTSMAKFMDDRRKEEFELYKQRGTNFEETRKEMDRVILGKLDELEEKQGHQDFHYNTDEEDDLEFEDIRGFPEYQGDDHLNPKKASSSSSAAAPAFLASGSLTKVQRQAAEKEERHRLFVTQEMGILARSSYIEDDEAMVKGGFCDRKSLNDFSGGDYLISFDQDHEFTVLKCMGHNADRSFVGVRTVAKSENYGDARDELNIPADTIARQLGKIGIRSIISYSEKNVIIWAKLEYEQQFNAALNNSWKLLPSQVGSTYGRSTTPTWKEASRVSNDSRHLSGLIEPRQYKGQGFGDFGSSPFIDSTYGNMSGGDKTSTRRTGHLKRISESINMTRQGLSLISNCPDTALTQNTFDVQNRFSYDEDDNRHQGMNIPLQACQIITALGGIIKHWRELVNLHNPGPFGRLQAAKIYNECQGIGDTPNPVDLGRTAEEIIGHDIRNIEALFMNIIQLHNAAYLFTANTLIALHEMRERLTNFLKLHEFGAPHERLSDALYLKAIEVFCIDMTRLLKQALSGTTYQNEDHWLQTVKLSPDVRPTSILYAYHQTLMYKSISTNSGAIVLGDTTPKNNKEIKEERRRKKLEKRGTKVDKVVTDGHSPPDAKGQKKICYHYLTTVGCSRPAGTCKFAHRDPKTDEYSEVKTFLEVKSDLVLKAGIKLE